MKTYRIAVDYAVCGIATIKAYSFKDALEKAEHVNIGEITDKEYIDESWNVNVEMSEDFCSDDYGKVE